MKKKDRLEIGSKMRYELQDGSHTFTMCNCNRHGAKGKLCWECLLELLEDKK